MKTQIKTTLVKRSLILATGLLALNCYTAPLKIVNVSAPEINCLLSSTYTVVANDTRGPFQLNATLGNGVLQTRTFVADAGTPLAGLYAYVYRIDLTGATATHAEHEQRREFQHCRLTNRLRL